MKCCPLCIVAAAVVGGSLLAFTVGMGPGTDPAQALKDKADKAIQHVDKQIDKATGQAAAAQPGKPSMEEMMAAMEKAATPGKEHEMLKVFEGEWDAEMTMIMEGMPPSTMKGKATFTMELGGRAIKQVYNAKSEMGEFTGIGFSGYDNVSKRWWSNWMDNWSTSCMMMYGTYDAKTRTWNDVSEPAQCPMGQGMMTMRTVLTMKSDDAFTFTMYSTIEGQKETKSGEILYTRVKK